MLRNKIKRVQVEGLDMPQTTLEALQNLASMYKEGVLTISKLKVTQDADIAGNLKLAKDVDITGALNVGGKSTLPTARVGEWEIRRNRIGIPNRSDMTLDSDYWIRLYAYDQNDYAGNAGGSGGFAGRNAWCDTGTIWTKNLTVNGNTNLIKEDENIVINNKNSRNHYNVNARYMALCGNADCGAVGVGFRKKDDTNRINDIGTGTFNITKASNFQLNY